MNHSSVSIQATIHAEQRGERDTRLHGRRLVLARVFWIVIAIFELGMFAVSLPGFVTQLQTPCTSSCAGWQLSVDAVKQLSVSWLLPGKLRRLLPCFHAHFGTPLLCYRRIAGLASVQRLDGAAGIPHASWLWPDE